MKPSKCFPLINHAKQRLKERVSTTITKEDIQKHLKLKNITYVRKLTISRSLGYCKINDHPVKLIITKNGHKIITVLPLNYEYECDWYYVLTNGKQFRIKIFPDCFKETEDKRKLTQFQKFNPVTEEWENAKMLLKNYFEIIFDTAWKEYEKNKITKKTKEI